MNFKAPPTWRWGLWWAEVEASQKEDGGRGRGRAGSMPIIYFPP